MRRWYEVYCYTDAKPIFKTFLQILASYKIRYSGFPRDITTDTSKVAYCEKINKQMHFFDKRLELTVDNVEDNHQLRQAFKLGSNSLLGKLSQDGDKDKHINVNNQQDLEELFYNDHYEISELIPISDYVVQARVTSRAGFNRPNLKGDELQKILKLLYC